MTGYEKLGRLGRASWATLGIVGVIVVVALVLGAVSGIVIPLVIAVILATVLEPLANWLKAHRVAPSLATAISLLVAVVVSVATIVLVVRGFLQQLPEISRELARGWRSFLQWGRSLDLDTAWIEYARGAIQQYLPDLSHGVLGFISTTFTGAIGFAIGTFFAVFFLFFVLRDGHLFPAWLARSTHLNPVLVQEIDTLSRQSLRAYFKGTAITALITAPIFIVPLILLGVPLVLPMFILYFFLSFIPYVGAWITGAFAVLIAFGSGGASAALIVSISLLVSNGAVQSAVSSWALGSSLKMHPVAVLLATIIGGTVAGMIGMILAPPLVAAAQKSVLAARELSASQEPVDEGSSNTQ